MSEMPEPRAPDPATMGIVDRSIHFCLHNKLIIGLLVAFFVGWGVMTAPFDWEMGFLPRNPVAVDAIPDIGENQQIVFTEWEGRSPQDIDDQITYPLTTALLGVPGVKTVRSYSYFGFSTIFIIFEEKVDFYWSRSRVLEKLSSLPPGSLPEGVQPALGPDATALGQVYWYTLEGQDPDGRPAGGWDLDELRSIQDWHVRFALLGAGGVSEVASIGGFVREYQIDVDPDAMRAHDVMLEEVFEAVRASNADVGARTIEVNRVEYTIRGLGFIKDLADIEQIVLKSTDNVPIRVKDVATVTRGPEMRRGVLDKQGAEAVGGVVVVRYGANPLEVIKNVKDRIREIEPGLPTKAVVDYHNVDRAAVTQFAANHGIDSPYNGAALNQESWLAWLRATPRDQWPAWIATSKVAVVTFYDRTGLIHETLNTLGDALYQQILITIIVVIVMVMHLRSSLLITGVLPLAILTCFIMMKLFGVDANIVALSGIAIAIGTLVDMGIIICENILRHLQEARPGESRADVIFRAASEVGSAILTAVGTTIVGFLPVFTMTGPEGKLFRPLAFTKTFALTASVLVAIAVIPALAHLFFRAGPKAGREARITATLLIMAGLLAAVFFKGWLGFLLVLIGAYVAFSSQLPDLLRRLAAGGMNLLAAVLMAVLLTRSWMPLGGGEGLARNLVFVGAMLVLMLGFFLAFQTAYGSILRFCLRHKVLYLCLPLTLVMTGYTAWLGFDTLFGFVPHTARWLGIPEESVRRHPLWSAGVHAFPGFGKEFMPPLDEGSYLYMPTTMPHASVAEALDIIQKQDQAIAAIPEVDSVVGKMGRAESPLDPAPMSMIETVINYKPEYVTDAAGHVLTYRYDQQRQQFVYDAAGQLIEDPGGRPFRQWREHIKAPGDIWAEIVAAAQLPGTTSAPELQPIAARIVMLQSGMRAPMGVKIKGPDLATIERVGLEIEVLLKEVPGVAPATVIADRIVGSPYLEIDIDREAIGRYGLLVRDVQNVIEMALGGMPVTTTVEGRERYPIRVRYKRELRDQIESLGLILVPAPGGEQVPLAQLAEVRYTPGPMAIKSEDTFLVSYVLFDKEPGHTEVDVVEQCEAYLEAKRLSGEWALPAGVSYRFAGSYENQVHAQRTLMIVLPASLFIMFIILYLQFSSVLTTLIVFSSITAAWGGGMLLLWFCGQSWFMDFAMFGINMRELFHIHPVNLSVAVWVGFIALFGVAEDDGVVIATYLDQSFEKRPIRSVEDIREAVVAAGLRRIRPCLMTTSTTILALIPVFTSTGRGSDLMIPMALPSFGGMLIVLFTLFIVPTLYCWVKEARFRLGTLTTPPNA